jgi:hypothetical protein
MEYYEYEIERFNIEINESVKSALELVKGGRLFGIELNINNPNHVIAMLYNMYNLKEYLVKTI